MLDLKKIGADWTLFLDRDGVVNKEKYQDYVYNYSEFIFYEGVTGALKVLAERFSRILIVTNQRGIGRGLMTDADLEDIHFQMIRDVKQEGGRIDRIYYCSSLDDRHPERKPNPGMAHAARRDFPDIDFSRSVIAGNSPSDMEFGRNAGMYTVFIRTTHPGQVLPYPTIDLAYDSLADFAKALQSA